jgi:rod shape-determining protein MreB
VRHGLRLVRVVGLLELELTADRLLDLIQRDGVALAGLPKTISVTSEEIREALSEPLSSILEAIRIALERTPPELSADLIDRGLILAGGGSLLRGLDKLISEETGLPVHVADDPLTAVALGTGRYLSDFNLLKRLAVNSNAAREY